MSLGYSLVENRSLSDAHLAAKTLAELEADARQEYWATLALRHCPGLGARSQVKLLKRFASAASACHAFREWPQLGVPANCAQNFASELWRDGAKKEWDCAKRSSAQILLWLSAEYPASLRELADAPVLLYCRGNLSLLAGPCVAIVGTRNPTVEGLRMAAAIAGPISASGLTVVSGMALGIDREAHIAALEGVGRSIGILGTGIDVDYPKTNSDIFAKMRRDGLLISEFIPDAAPVACNFPIRNRIISGLSLGVVVIEAANRSGSLITARFALEQNREVFAVPGSPLNSHYGGCQNLIRQGARAIFSPDDLLLDLAPSLRAFGSAPRHDAEGERDKDILAPPEPEGDETATAENDAALGLLGTTDAEKVLALLRGDGPMQIDILLDQTGLDSGKLSAALLALEMLGRIRPLPGAFYEAL